MSLYKCTCFLQFLPIPPHLIMTVFPLSLMNTSIALLMLTFRQKQPSSTDLNSNSRWKQEAFSITKQREEITLAY